LDWEWHKNEKAKSYLQNLGFLKNTWQENGKIFAEYSHDGRKLSTDESHSLYGGIIPYFKILYPDIAKEIYFKKLAFLYNPDVEDFSNDVGYYAQNWVWFGIAFYEGKLINLYTVAE